MTGMTGIFAFRRRADEDAGTALVLVLTAIMVAAALGVLILGMVLVQVKPTLQQRKHARTLSAAESGLNMGLAQMRAATTSGQGDRSKLPCGTFTGSVGGEQGNVQYQATIRYYLTDPSQQSASWRDAHALACVAGYGPSQTPAYALVQAEGAGDSAPGQSSTTGDRTLESIYTMRVTNANVSGGLVHNYADTAGGALALCMDAGSGSPSAGAVVQARVCLAANVARSRQLFAYTPAYNLVLTSTVSTSKPDGMCVTYNGANANLVMQDCTTAMAQKWGINAGAQFQYAANATSTKYCIAVQNDNVSLAATSSICGQAFSWRWAWAPEPKVGAGNAGPNQQQLVNYKEFGRCFDVTGWHLDYAYMIAYPCKQDPNGSPGWNEQLTNDTNTHHLIVNGSSCVTAPTTAGGYVTMTGCSSSSRQQWTVIGATGDYSTAYTITDYQGRCLAVGPPNMSDANDAPGYTLRQWSTIVSATCDGSTGQKWNAPPNLIDAANGNTREITGQ
jgi:hypothetical protein